jgi:hypothetical protein
MVLKLETGKFYKTRDGQKVGPVIYRRECDDYAVDGFAGPYGRAWWTENGIRGGVGDIHEGDIIAEWAESPVRTVTIKRKELIEGEYGLVRLDLHRGVRVVYIPPENGYQASASELRAAAATLTEIADALEQTP